MVQLWCLYRLYNTRPKPVFFLCVYTSTVHCSVYIRNFHAFPLIRFYSVLPPGGGQLFALRNFGESAVLQLRAPVFMPVVRPWHIFCTLECALTCLAQTTGFSHCENNIPPPLPAQPILCLTRFHIFYNHFLEQKWRRLVLLAWFFNSGSKADGQECSVSDLGSLNTDPDIVFFSPSGSDSRLLLNSDPEKDFSWRNAGIVFWSKNRRKRLRNPTKDAQALQTWNFLIFSSFVRLFWPSWIRIHNRDPDPDSRSGSGFPIRIQIC
jgi:hypothetical protein